MLEDVLDFGGEIERQGREFIVECPRQLERVARPVEKVGGTEGA